MPRYRIGDKTFNRKHTWLPCVIGDRFDAMTDEEQVAAYKATRWAELITNSEWPALLGHEGASKTAKSRLKKKVIWWLMALGRIAALNPNLYNQAVREAKTLYEEQLEHPHPMFYSLDQASTQTQGAPGVAGGHLITVRSSVVYLTDVAPDADPGMPPAEARRLGEMLSAAADIAEQDSHDG